MITCFKCVSSEGLQTGYEGGREGGRERGSEGGKGGWRKERVDGGIWREGGDGD